MKTKQLRIVLINGHEIIRDISNENIAPIGSPANHESYARMCSIISVNGYTDTAKTDSETYTHIAPSQIKSVAVEFI